MAMYPTRSLAPSTTKTPVPAHDPKRKGPASRPQVRRYTTTTLLPNGDICETRHLAPALPLFEDAFCAFARGTLIETDMGPIAVEDILPGDRVITGDGSMEEVIWKGNVTIVPGLKHVQKRDMRLTRFTPDSLGMSRPMSSIICGPSARLLHTPDQFRAMSGGNRVLSTVRSFVDGVNIIETAPPTAVELYHICLPRHTTLRIGAMEFESYHPGTQSSRMISHAMRSLFLNLFPHVETVGGFGPVAFPRVGDGQVDAIGA